MSFSANGMVNILRPRGDDLIGAEIGVDKGESTKGLLNKCENIKKIYAIDPWTEYKALTQEACDKNYLIAKEYLRSYVLDNNIEIIKEPSLQAVLDFKDLSLDFVYIDGDHSFEAAYADICAWYPKVKSGGVVSGHDFRPEKDWEVKAAIRKFTDDNGYEIIVIPQGWSWYFIKR
jgi:predicted O-methyltransferase YrrM